MLHTFQPFKMTGALQVGVLWCVSAVGTQHTETSAANETAGRFFGGRWFPREGRICEAQLQALRWWHAQSLTATQSPGAADADCCTMRALNRLYKRGISVSCMSQYDGAEGTVPDVV